MPRSAVPRSRAHAHSKAAHAQTHARSHSLTHAALRCAQVHVVAAGGKVDADAAAEQTALDRHAAAASARLRAQKATIDADAVGQFCDMGFPLNAVSRALPAPRAPIAPARDPLLLSAASTAQATAGSDKYAIESAMRAITASRIYPQLRRMAARFQSPSTR